MRKKRILWPNEFSLLGTGFSTYGLEILKRLHATGKYDIAEFSLYVHHQDPRIQKLPWTVYTNIPLPQNQPEIDAYNNSPSAQFGADRFEEVCLDFKPDIVLSILDPWMLEYKVTSPFRPYYNLALMPTYDSSPYIDYWIDLLTRADAVFTYSQWAHDSLEKEGGGQIKLMGRASPAADPETYFPVADKAQHKTAFGIDPNSYIIGTVMRNQKRKLYPDILESFNLFLDKCRVNKNRDLELNSYLYFHTSYPDLGWDLPGLLKDYGLSHKVYFTHFCKACGYVFPSFFRGAQSVCAKCGQYAVGLPNTQNPVETRILGGIVNCFDVYVQHAIAEGFCLSVPEAASCGIHSFVTDYSALEDYPKFLKSTPIKVQKKFLEAETQAYRVYPDNEHLASELYKHFNLPDQWRAKRGRDAREGYEKHYSYDVAAKKWEDYFDSVEIKDNWGCQPRLHQPQTQLPANCSNQQFVTWILANVLGEPERINSYQAVKLAKDLEYGAYIPGFGGHYLNEASFMGSKPVWQPFNRNDAAQMLYNECEKRNYWEQRRVGMIRQDVPDYIKYAKREK